MNTKAKILYMVLGICLAGLGILFVETYPTANGMDSSSGNCRNRYQISAGTGGAFVLDTVSGLVFFASADSLKGVKFHGPPALVTGTSLRKR